MQVQSVTVVPAVVRRRRVKGDPLVATASDLKIEGFVGCFLYGTRCQGVGSMTEQDGIKKLWCKHREEYVTREETQGCTMQT
jgi:hypothetical protein